MEGTAVRQEHFGVVVLSAKEEFVQRFGEMTGGMHPNDFKLNPKGLAAILSGSEELQELYHKALEEQHGT